MTGFVLLGGRGSQVGAVGAGSVAASVTRVGMSRRCCPWTLSTLSNPQWRAGLLRRSLARGWGLKGARALGVARRVSGSFRSFPLALSSRTVAGLV